MAAGHDHPPDRSGGPPGHGPDEPVEMPPLSPAETSGPQPSDVERVLHRHRARLSSLAGVEGFGIGRTAAGTPAIVVYLRAADLDAAVPADLDGFPVIPVVTGRIEPL